MISEDRKTIVPGNFLNNCHYRNDLYLLYEKVLKSFLQLSHKIQNKLIAVQRALKIAQPWQRNRPRDKFSQLNVFNILLKANASATSDPMNLLRKFTEYVLLTRQLCYWEKEQMCQTYMYKAKCGNNYVNLWIRTNKGVLNMWILWHMASQQRYWSRCVSLERME